MDEMYIDEMTRIIDELIESKNEYIKLLEDRVEELEIKLKKENKNGI